VDDFYSSADPRLQELADTVGTHYSGTPDAKFDWNKAESSLRKAVRRARKKRKAQSPLPQLNQY
jgi:hypothetical protein